MGNKQEKNNRILSYFYIYLCVMQEEIPAWLEVGRLIDAKDKHGDWQVALVQRAAKNQIRVRYDGWQAKYDENFNFNSPDIRPFRSVITGYTGQVKNAGIREHMIFDLTELEEIYFPRLEEFINNLPNKSADEITQVLRGHHYILVDFYLSGRLSNKEDARSVYNYFKRHIDLNLLYLRKMLESDLSGWFNNPDHDKRAFADAHFEIFDATIGIFECYPRHRDFFHHGAAVFAEAISPVGNLKYWNQYLLYIDFYPTLAQLINKIDSQQGDGVPLSFARSLTYLYSAIEKVMQDKQVKLQLAQSMSRIIIKAAGSITEHNVKVGQKQLEDIYGKFKLVIMKYSWKGDVLAKMEVARLNCWEKMIKSESLDRKIKGIGHIKKYFEQLASDNKLIIMIYGEISQQKKWLKEKAIIELIFCQNEHHEIIKKGCELALTLYAIDCIGGDELQVIWNSCRERLEAVRKIMYSFFRRLVKIASVSDLQVVEKLIEGTKMTEEYDVEFFYSFAEEVVELKKEDASGLVHNLIAVAMERASQDISEVKKFATILVLNNDSIVKFYVQDIITKIGQRDNIYFNLKALIEIYSISELKEYDLSESSFKIVLTQLTDMLVLHDKVKTKDTPESLQIYSMLLKVLEYLQEEFQFFAEEFATLWTLFSLDGNLQLRDKIFYNWVLHCQSQGLLKLPNYSLNKCFKDFEFQLAAYENIIKNSQQLDYINMSLVQFFIFRQFLLEVNAMRKKLVIKSLKFTGLKIFRVLNFEIDGLNELWSIFLNCRNEEVVPHAANLLQGLYMNFPENLAATEEGLEEKNQRVKALLLKLDKNIKSGLQKTNMKLINRSLLLLKEVIAEVKESKPIPPEFILTSSAGENKRHVQVIYKDQQINKEVPFSQSMKNFKKSLEADVHIKSYHFKILKLSNHASPAPNKGNTTITQEQIIKEELLLPMFTVVVGHEKINFVVRQAKNHTYKLITEFIGMKMEESLLKILSETDELSHEASEAAYTILIDIPSQREPSEVINKLISAHPKMQSLSVQSPYYRMYMAKNVNLLPQADLKEFIKEGWVFESILQDLRAPILQFMTIQLLLEVVSLAIKSARLVPIPLTPQDIIECMNNEVSYLAKQKPNPQDNDRLLKKMKLFASLFSLLEHIFSKKYSLIIDSMVQSPCFPQLMESLFKDEAMSNSCRQIFDVKFSIYTKEIRRSQAKHLSESSQEKLFQMLFGNLYPHISQRDFRYLNNSYLFHIMKDFISVLGQKRLEALFKTDSECIGCPGCSGCMRFWDNCLNVIRSEADFSSAEDKENNFLYGHLLLMQVLISRNHKVISQQLNQYIFYECLFFHKEHTKSETVKCWAPRTIQLTFSLLQIISHADEKSLGYFIEQLRQLQQTKYWRVPDKWNVSLENELKSETGYVGLQNPGCICYLNSFMQTLFMNKEFRRNVINYQGPIRGDSNQHSNILSAMKELFLNLSLSDKKFLSPLDFTRTIKTADNKPMIKIFQQMDIEEFSSILFDKIENLLPADKNFVKDIYQGVYSNEIISQQCKHCSEREENFISIQIDVKSSVQQSLKTLVKGEMLEGQNAYYCERCDKKVRALKRVSLKKLPDCLLICLKRFEYNFQIDQKIKLNNYCEFTQDFCLEEYSQQYLNRDNPRPQHEQQETFPSHYFDYKLKGVIIHTGFADSGHYYAIEEVEPGKWLEFNDSFVTEFKIQKLPEEAFGSKDMSENKVKNAYMLVYERKNKMPVEESMEAEETNNSVQSQSALEISKQIEQVNKEIHVFDILFGPEYYRFIQNILNFNLGRVVSPEIKSNLIKYFLEYCLLVRLRENNLMPLIENLALAEKLLFSPETPEGAVVVDALIEEMAKKDFIFEFFLEVSSKERVFVLSRFLSEILLKKIEVDQKKCYPKILIALGAFLEVMISTESALNEFCYIFRRLFSVGNFYRYYEELDITTILFDNISYTRLTPEDKNQKIQTIHLNLKEILKNFPEIEEKASLGIERKQHPHYPAVVKSESVEEAWLLILKMYASQEQIIELGSNAENSQSDYSADSAYEFFKMVETHHNYIVSQFDCLTYARLNQLFYNCTSARNASLFSYFLCEISKNSKVRTEKIIATIAKSLKAAECIKFRPFLIALFHLCDMNDDVDSFRMEYIQKNLEGIMEANGKYFSEADVLLQWIEKICACNPKFVKFIHGSEFVGDLLELAQNQKMPTTELLKKQKNVNYERLQYRLHGLMVSPDIYDYSTLYNEKNKFFDTLFQQRFESTYDKKFMEPSLSALENGYHVGQQLQYFHDKHWITVVVKEEKFGLVKLCRKGTEESTYLWEYDDRLREQDPEEAESEMQAQI